MMRLIFRRRERGFTLIEFLIIIAVIAILSVVVVIVINYNATK